MLGLAPGRLKVTRENGSLRSVLPPQIRKMVSTVTRAYGRLPDEPASTDSPLDADAVRLLPPPGRRQGWKIWVGVEPFVRHSFNKRRVSKALDGPFHPPF